MPVQPFTSIYDNDYFSGSQVSIYIGDVWVDEVTSLSYQCSQNKTPIYGYASQLFDAVAPGQVIVQGNFTINYKEQGYLWAVLSRYKRMMPESESKERTEGEGDKKITRTGVESSPISVERNEKDPNKGHTRVSHATIERLVGGNMTRDEKNDHYLSIAGYATFDTDSAKDRAFADLAETFENYVWGGTVPIGSMKYGGYDFQARRADSNKFDDFDMYIVFGNYTNDKANHTAQKIEGVRLLSQGKQIMVGGAPVQESYEFLARTVI